MKVPLFNGFFGKTHHCCKLDVVGSCISLEGYIVGMHSPGQT